jgi:hypothetical protein
MENGGNSSDPGTKSEVLVRRIIGEQLARGETLLEGMRFTDPRHGDVEADFLILIPEVGVAVLEVKGGVVSYENGQWLTTNKGTSRRISPIEQARKAKHALRRFLDRSPEWHNGLIRAQWFVVMPFTEVSGDMGAEGAREQLLGASDLDDLLPRIRASLGSTLNNDPLPSADDLDLALTLLLRTQHASLPSVSAAAGSKMKKKNWAIIAVGGAVIAALAVVGLVAQNSPSSSSTECNPNYEPCIPIAPDLSCSDIQEKVRIIGDDPYGLDRDGDGFGCEIYE